MWLSTYVIAVPPSPPLYSRVPTRVHACAKPTGVVGRGGATMRPLSTTFHLFGKATRGRPRVSVTSALGPPTVNVDEHMTIMLHYYVELRTSNKRIKPIMNTIKALIQVTTHALILYKAYFLRYNVHRRYAMYI